MEVTATMDIVPKYERRSHPVKDAELRKFAILAAPLEYGRDELRVYREADGTLAFRELTTGPPMRVR